MPPRQRRPHHGRRLGLVPGRRNLSALALGALLATVPAAAARADANAGQTITATVFAPGGSSTDTVSVGALEGDAQRCPPYTGPNVELYRSNGSPEPDQSVTGNAWSLATVLGCLSTPVPLAAVQGVTVLKSSGTPEASLTPADLRTPSDFANSAESPLAYSDGSNLFYDRPWRGSGDANAGDQVIQGGGAPLSLEVFEGPLLKVSITPSATSVAAGASVSFTATVSPSDAPGLSYSWNFGDGTTTASPAPSETFSSAGQYPTSVQVTDTSGGGGSDSVPITVTGASPTSTGPKPTSGPDRSGGVKPDGSPGPRRAGSGPTPTATAPPRTTPATSTTASAPSPSPRAGAHMRARASARRRPRPHQASPPSTTVASPVVSGLLISAVSPIAATQSPLVHTQPASVASAPARRVGASPTPLPAVAGGLAVVLLLGLGAGRELRGRRAWRTLRLSPQSETS